MLKDTEGFVNKIHEVEIGNDEIMAPLHIVIQHGNTGEITLLVCKLLRKKMSGHYQENIGYTSACIFSDVTKACKGHTVWVPIAVEP